MFANTINGMRVRHVWLNGKQWTDHTPRFGPNVGQHFIAVRRNAGQRYPRMFGPELAAILREAANLDN